MPFRTNLKPGQISNHGKQLQVGWSSYSLRKLTFSSPGKNMLTPRIKHPQYLATSNRTLHKAHLGMSIPCGRAQPIQESTLYKDTEGLLFLSTVPAVVPLPVPRALNLHECSAGIITPSLGISLTDPLTGTLHQRRAHLTAALCPAKLVHPAVQQSLAGYQVT